MGNIHRTDSNGLDLQVHRATIQSVRNALGKNLPDKKMTISKSEIESFSSERLMLEKKLDLQKKVEELNESIANSGKEIRFKYNDDAEELYVEVIDKATQEVIASLPPEFLIELSIKMKELIGMFLDEKI